MVETTGPIRARPWAAALPASVSRVTLKENVRMGNFYFAGAAGAVTTVTRCARATLFDDQSDDQAGGQHPGEPRPARRIKERLHLRVPYGPARGLEGNGEPQHRRELQPREPTAARHPETAHKLRVSECEEE